MTQGWTHTPSEGFLAHVGGLWERNVDGQAEFGFLAEEMHANRNGVVHGGMLMTFIDRAFGQTARLASGAPRAATINLNTSFMMPMRIGSFATLRPKVVKLTKRLAFMEGTVICGDDVLTSAQGVWRLASSTTD
ncbi:PaaI family thioesterase [Telmatospirillum sp. J64-1]|uniref:PaaI family thioesterase n=1 Tax=Telmatospirillum sp. J64-1 TaxID=2502183 RepID=UPI001C8F9730|nr:PaaI family thioesterase [Telmatospirillum sp. J64-1]